MTTKLIARANKGIGLETGRRSIADGHDVWVAARDPERGRAAPQPAGGWFVELEVTDAATVARAVQPVPAESGWLDVLIHNAGRTPSYE